MNKKHKDTGSPLTKVVEECSEVIKMACKIDRFGWFSYHPDDPDKVLNIELLQREMDDVIATFTTLDKHIMELKTKYYKYNKNHD